MQFRSAVRLMLHVQLSGDLRLTCSLTQINKGWRKEFTSHVPARLRANCFDFGESLVIEAGCSRQRSAPPACALTLLELKGSFSRTVEIVDRRRAGHAIPLAAVLIPSISGNL